MAACPGWRSGALPVPAPRALRHQVVDGLRLRRTDREDRDVREPELPDILPGEPGAKAFRQNRARLSVPWMSSSGSMYAIRSRWEAGHQSLMPSPTSRPLKKSVSGQSFRFSR